MRAKYFFQKLLGKVLNAPIIPKGKTTGYSLIKSEKANSSIGEKTRIYPPFFLHGVSLGEYSCIARNSSITNCKIGKFCSIGPNFCCGLGIHPVNGISTSPMFYSTASQNGFSLCERNKVEEFRETIIGNDVFIGANVTVLDGVTIGDGAVIGAGAVVTKDIPPYAIAIGVPARVKNYRFNMSTITKLLQSKWWDGDMDTFSRVESCFFDIGLFLGCGYENEDCC